LGKNIQIFYGGFSIKNTLFPSLLLGETRKHKFFYGGFS
jgi:hypothetical protein